VKAPEPANLKAELHDEFHIAKLMFKTGRDGLRHIGELFGPS
jgi:hypothetical protein